MSTFAKIAFFLLLIIAVFTGLPSVAQTISINNVDPGPYSPGTTIAVPVNIDNSGGCIKNGNSFYLYLSDATGSFAAPTLIGQVNNNYYASFINGTIPAAALPSALYRVEVVSTNPAVTSTASTPFTIGIAGGPAAGIDAPAISSAAPGVFGNCNNAANYTFNFLNTSTSGSTTTVSFYNELTKTTDQTLTNVGSGGSFATGAASYTIVVKAVKGGLVGTKAYTLINNKVNTSFGSTGNATLCIDTQTGGMLSYSVDINSANGLQYNYPGNTYLVTWGDGNASTYTYCDIKAAGGTISHLYTTTSCGNAANGQKNIFEIDLQTQSLYCGLVGTKVTSYAQVLKKPVNEFLFPSSSCTGSLVTFSNSSDPGQDPNSTSGSCVNTNGLYSWYVDGTIVAFNKSLSDKFTYTFTTHGYHTVGLELQNNTATCTIPVVTHTICIQDPPKPSFTITGAVNNTFTTCAGNNFSPTNTSEVDLTGCSTNAYSWTLTGPGTQTQTSSTYEPVYNLTAAGIYTLKLAISSASCTSVPANTTYTIVINSAPVTKLSANFSTCGKGQAFTFDNNATQTKTTLAGTNVTQPNTYTWTVTGGTYSFINNTNANSQYPSIMFNDLGTYTVTVKHINECSAAQATQTITFVQSPTMIPGADQTICYNSIASLNGSFTGQAPNSVLWTSSGTGTFSNKTAYVTTYIPSAADKTSGVVTLTLTGATTNPAPCTNPSASLNLTISAPGNMTTPNSKSICSGSSLNYALSADIPNSTFTWTAAVTSGSATGFTNGSGNSINDVITNNNAVTNAVVTYTITPTSPSPASCPGNPFTLTITVTPNPVITLKPITDICTGFPANIQFSSNLTNTSYIWTATLLAGTNVTGFSSQGNPVFNTSIQDNISNNGTTLATVQYTITPISPNGCYGTPVNATINIQPSPKTPDPGTNDEVCNVTSYQLKGNDPSPGTGKWTVSSGPSGTIFANAANPQTTVSGLIPGNAYVFTWTITATPSCPSLSNSVTITDDAPTIGGVTSGSATVCAGNNAGQITLSGYVGKVLHWESSIDNGTTWVTITNASPIQVYNNPSQTVKYRALVQNGTCPVPLYSSISTITVNPATPAADAGADDSICNLPNYTLKGNDPGTFSGKWTLLSGQTGVTFADATKYNTIVTGLNGGNVYVFQWTIFGLPPCADNSKSVTITDNAPGVAGTTSGSTTVCAGNNSGQITLSGYVGSIIRWESSIDNGTTWTAINNTSPVQVYTNPAQTIQYRAVVQSGVCPPPLFSTASTVKVNPATPAADAGQPDAVCNQASYTLKGNDPVTFAGKWTLISGQAGVTFADATKYNTTVTGLLGGNVYVFQWTIFGLPPCVNNTSTVTITDNAATVGGTTSGSTSVCAGTNSGQITLSGYVGTILRWESSIDNGITWTTIGNTNAVQNYNDPAQTIQYRAVVQNGNCVPPVPSTVSTITVNPVTPAANAGASVPLCNQSSYTLQGNDPGTFAGKWTLTTGQTGVTFADATKYNTTVTGLKGGNTYIFQWTIIGLAPCADNSDQTTITDLGVVTNALSTTSPTICAGQPVTITGSTPSGGTGAYTYSWEYSLDDQTWSTISDETSKDITTPVLQVTTWYRRTVVSGNCSTISNEQKIVVQQTIANNTIQSASGETCYNTSPQPVIGSTPTGGDGTYFYQWQSSPDGITFTDISGANTINYQPPVLTSSMQYRRIVSTTLCSGQFKNVSNPFTITVNPDAKAAFTAIKTVDCAPFVITGLNVTATNDPGTGVYEWFAGTTSIGTGLSFPGYTITQDGVTVQITLKVTSKYGCKTDSYSLNFSTVKQVVGNFTANTQNGCGPLHVSFTNTSTPLNGANYTWSFGDGTPDYHGTQPPEHIFVSDETGKDIVYTVTLTPDGCLPTPASMNITVFPAVPIARIRPHSLTGCAPFVVTVDNISPGTNIRYTYYLYNGAKLVERLGPVTDKSTVSFTTTLDPPTFTQYTLYMIAENQCGQGQSISYPINVSPSTIVAAMSISSANQGNVCPGQSVTLTNLADGGTSYTYNIYDANHKVIDSFDATRADETYILPAGVPAGKYYATITATNGCSTVESDPTKAVITLYPTPVPAFHTDNASGCDQVTVTFTNDTQSVSGSPASTFQYNWDFGDGSTSTTLLNTFTHVYNSDKSPYTVTLTASTPNGCSNTIVKTGYIVVNSSPVAKFTASPGLITSIPNYHFAFTDKSTGGPLAWSWDFGDKSTSTRENPEHTYADTGKYVVTLTVRNTNTGCQNTITQTVQITGVPGQLYVPNSFMPGSATSELRTFKAKGSGIQSWYLRIFNNWGQLIFETTQLTAKGEPLGEWDGTYKGVQMPQGVYPYEIEAIFINGTVWKGMSYNNSAPKRAGVIHLIR